MAIGLSRSTDLRGLKVDGYVPRRLSDCNFIS